MEETTLTFAPSADASKIYRQSTDINVANFNTTAVLGNTQTIEASGPAVIVDGDTLEIGPQKIRIFGIDAAETGAEVPAPERRLGSRWQKAV